MLFYEQQYLLDIYIYHIFVKLVFLKCSFPCTKNWFIIVWQKENNFPIPRKRNNCTQEVFKLICKKMTIYFSGELRLRKKAPFLRSMHHSHMWSYTQWGCLCNTNEWQLNLQSLCRDTIISLQNIILPIESRFKTTAEINLFRYISSIYLLLERKFWR